MPSTAPAPLYLSDLWPGALAIARKLGLVRLTILSREGRPLATFDRRPYPPKIDHPHPTPRPDEPAVNLSLILSFRLHPLARWTWG